MLRMPDGPRNAAGALNTFTFCGSAPGPKDEHLAGTIRLSREEKIMSPDQRDPREKQIADLHAGIRQISHDLSNPLGILRMAVYFLQSTKAEAEKREQYLTMMNETIDRVEQQLNRLRALTEPRAGGNSPGTEEENRP